MIKYKLWFRGIMHAITDYIIHIMSGLHHYIVAYLGLGPGIGLAVRENQSKNMQLKKFNLAKALVNTSF